MEKPITILHLSDLHLSSKYYSDQSVVLNALWNDIRRLRANDFTFDMAFFTGDLIAKGMYTKENVTLAKDSFFSPLIDSTGISRDRVFVVPGNHDIDTSSRSPFLQPAFDGIKSQDDIQKTLENLEQATLETGLSEYYSLVDQVSANKPVFQTKLYSAYHLDIDGISIGIAAINSAWKATGRPDNYDYGKLIVGRRQLEQMYEALKGCQIVFSLLHHPTNWLSLLDATVVQRQFQMRTDGIFYGHNHESDGTAIAGTIGSYFASNAGCLYQSREYFNGYAAVKFYRSSGKWQVYAREYYEERQAFDAALRFSPSGMQSFCTSPRDPDSIDSVPSAEFIERVCETVDRHLLSHAISDIAPSAFRDLYVDPPISTVSQHQLSAEAKNEGSSAFTELKDILHLDGPVLFVGPKESGKTSLLYRICSHSIDSGALAFPPFCGYVDLSERHNTRAKLLEALNLFSGSAYSKSQFISLMKAGSVAVCMDNLDSSNSKQNQLISDIVSEFPKCKFYFTVLETFGSSLSNDAIPSIGSNSQVFFIHPFGRRETRDLTTRWYGKSDQSLNAKVDGILNSLGRLNITRSPFLISALLWISESNISFDPVNQSAIIDALVDGVLDKLSESKSRSGIDSRIKRHFLSELAEQLHSKGARRISQHELERFTLDYFESRALNSPSLPLIGELTSKGILLESGDHISFKFDCIRAFFLAVRMSENRSLLDAALTEEGFLVLQEEIDYFTGMHRDQREVLEKSLEILLKLKEKADLGISLSFFDEINLPKSPFKDLHQAEFVDKILGLKPPQDKYEEVMDKLDGEAQESKVRHGRAYASPNQADNSFNRFVSAIKVSSSVLRNSELVNDPDLKYRAYTEIGSCWSELLIAVLASIDVLIEDEKSADFISKLIPPSMLGASSYFLKVCAPLAVLHMAVESLGTAKLQKTIERSLGEKGQAVTRFFDTYLYLDLKLPDRFEKLERLLEEFRGNRLICEAFFFKLVQMFLFSRLTSHDEKELRKLIGITHAILISAKSHQAKNVMKSNFLENLSRQRLGKSS